MPWRRAALRRRRRRSTAGVVVARVEARVQTGLDAPVLDVAFQPLRVRQLARGVASNEFDRLRLFPLALAVHTRGLRHQREACRLPIERTRDEGARDQFAFFQLGPAHCRGIG